MKNLLLSEYAISRVTIKKSPVWNTTTTIHTKRCARLSLWLTSLPILWWLPPMKWKMRYVVLHSLPVQRESIWYLLPSVRPSMLSPDWSRQISHHVSPFLYPPRSIHVRSLMVPEQKNCWEMGICYLLRRIIQNRFVCRAHSSQTKNVIKSLRSWKSIWMDRLTTKKSVNILKKIRSARNQPELPELS